MLDGIGEREEIAAGFLQPVAQRDQFLPAVDRDAPAVFEIAFELLRFDAKIDNVAVGPNEWMKRLDLDDGRSILLAAINACTVPVSPSSIATMRGVGSAPKSSVFFSKAMSQSTDCADFRRFKIGILAF